MAKAQIIVIKSFYSAYRRSEFHFVRFVSMATVEKTKIRYTAAFLFLSLRLCVFQQFVYMHVSFMKITVCIRNILAALLIKVLSRNWISSFDHWILVAVVSQKRWRSIAHRFRLNNEDVKRKRILPKFLFFLKCKSKNDQTNGSNAFYDFNTFRDESNLIGKQISPSLSLAVVRWIVYFYLSRPKLTTRPLL